MEKTFNPKQFEKRILSNWLDKGYFDTDVNSNKPKYSILMPPPNITGRLHLGHAMNNTASDCMGRYKRMNGFNVEYMPGTDHAAIATEAKLVEKLAKQNIHKSDMTRDEFEARIQEWYKEYGGIIIEQLKGLGIGADWKNLRFTRDEGSNKAVAHAFVELWRRGLIYRGERLTNWCPECNTAISDIEVEYEEKASKLYYIKYYLAGSTTKFLTVATTRPETLFGDLAVAINPNDPRYVDFVGKKVILPIVNIEIPVIADTYVDMEFGTGALKITPSHDINDYNLSKKHNLGFNQVIEKNGELNEKCGKFKGLKGLNARAKVAEYLGEIGLLVKTEDYNNKVGVCERCKTPIESLVSEQWYVKMDEIARKTKERIEAGEVSIVPETAKKRIYEWLNNIQDWCISRQLWTGHRIPVYYCQYCNEVYASEKPCACVKCGSENVKQDEDVLDTWFSSGLWPISTLGWPKDTEQLRKYYPYDLVVTGNDILTFWIARMLFMCIELEGVTPLKNVVSTGLVRDALGRKMSKNLGNGIDPTQAINEVGADTVRMALLYGNSIETDSRYDDGKIDNARRFINKIWNASRFVQLNMDGKEILPLSQCKLQLADKWILNELNDTIRQVRNNLDNLEINLALTSIFNFAWYEFCDYYIEFSKPNMQSSDKQIVNTTATILKYVLGEILKMLHPYIPFVTEEIYTNLYNEDTIMFAKWAEFNPAMQDQKAKDEMLSIMELTRSIRNLRTENKCDSKKILTAKLFVKGSSENLEENITYIQKLTNTNIILVDEQATGQNDLIITTPHYIIYLDGSELVNAEDEIARLNKEILKVTTDVEKLKAVLSNTGFIAKAPEQVVQKYKKDLIDAEDKLQTLKVALAKF